MLPSVDSAPYAKNEERPPETGERPSTDLRQREERRERGECGRKSKPDSYCQGATRPLQDTVRILCLSVSPPVSGYAFVTRLVPPDRYAERLDFLCLRSGIPFGHFRDPVKPQPF